MWRECFGSCRIDVVYTSSTGPDRDGGWRHEDGDGLSLEESRASSMCCSFVDQN